MYGPVLSALFLGMVPLWGIGAPAHPSAPLLTVAPPARADGTQMLAALIEPAPPRAQILSASAVLVIDIQSGQKLFGRDVDVPRPMASLTKQMTALLIVEKFGHALDTEMTVAAEAAGAEGNAVGLAMGDRFTRGDLLTAVLVASANDAATALAIEHSGSVSAFVEQMNVRAAELGLRDTVFVNPTGLDAPGQHSTPQDLAWLAMFALRYPQVVDRMGSRSAEIHSLAGKSITLSHTHALLHTAPDVLAGKTGTTDRAGQCLLSLVSEGGRKYLVVLLQSNDRYRDMRAILDALRA
ncbi:MAG: D-alanyl-D-alanine carboxypeptidase (penicillin-binding protein 5/6) [Candidatus Peregrinibacteria bacterium Gr01-1014_25]|nr:MAG: D-alanyl-D-alanine carboxypeptidase (penicillin-binding protein 5/6) [Candidatus Peregrinibacteria bacterium Gr01-1014_25]